MLTGLIWTNEKPTVPGLYWRRNGEHQVPYLALVFKGPNGLLARIVEEPKNSELSWGDNGSLERAVEGITSGAWAGPLAPRRSPEKGVDSQ